MPLEELVEAAARALCHQGYLDPHDVGEWPDELAGDLAALAELGCCRSCPVTLTPDALAGHWLARKEDEYERSPAARSETSSAPSASSARAA